MYKQSTFVHSPTGYSWIGDTFATFVGIAVGVETGSLASGIYGAIVGGALGGASASFMGSIFNGANLWLTAKNTFTGAFWGAASGTMNFETGNIENVFYRIAAHSVSEGVVEGIRGGHFEHGLLVGLASSSGGELITRYGTYMTYAERITSNAVLGGVVSELGGGKFANGAMTAAYTMMFNDLSHSKKFKDINWEPVAKKLERLYEEYGSDRNPILYKKMDGQLWKECGKYAERLVNACALKLCLALEKDGFYFPYVKGKTLRAANGRSYFVSAGFFYEFMKSNYPQYMHSYNTPLEMYNDLRKGGMFYQTSVDWTNRGLTGHVGAIYGHIKGGHLYESQTVNVAFY